MEFGITGGLSMSSHLHHFRFTDADVSLDLEPKLTMGYQAGVIARNNFSNKLRLQAEPSFAMLGARYEESFTLRGSVFQTDSRTELLYFQLPLVLQLSTAGPNETVFGSPYAKTTYHISGGVFGGYLLDARFSGTNTGTPIGVPFESDFSNDIVSQYSEYDGGAILGLGFEHGNKRKIGFETRAQFSVYDSGEPSQQLFESQNMAVTFSVYFLL
ncbi:PorT family protein [Aliifodinibius sp. S!AR15-10]|uniref:porin family protein n=1 Tax=Aliifodinibius sp. S!AR15-10 TaxID=2950437 RepID=UPI00285E4AAA|nr:porin family protein [Aliifodinibius sp. S!AR15-10]MDR8392375.1 PorT family protein [Aliifodinibius sp. S!AR15-10]